MGFLDRFKGGAKLAVVAEPAEAFPGDEVRVRVTVEGEIDDKAEGARAGLRCVNHFLVREYDRQDDEWEEKWRALTLHDDAGDVPLQAGEHELVFTVPTGMPPSSKNAVSWTAWAGIDRRRGLDATASAEIAVRLPAPPDPPRDVPPGEDGVAFEALPAAVRAGEQLEGTLVVTPADDIKTTGVRVGLRRTVTYVVDRSKVVRRDDVGEVEVAGGQELAAGQSQRFPFTVAVPADAGPTAQAPHAVVEWTVRGIVARRMRGDLEAAAPIVVHDA
jgi:hypothetical protein